jgi:hypothetical protein
LADAELHHRKVVVIVHRSHTGCSIRLSGNVLDQFHSVSLVSSLTLALARRKARGAALIPPEYSGFPPFFCRSGGHLH